MTTNSGFKPQSSYAAPGDDGKPGRVSGQGAVGRIEEMRARMTAQRKAIVEFIKEQGGVANTYAIQQEGLARTNAILHRMVDAGILIYVCSQYNYADRKREFLHIDEVPDAVRPELDRRIAETNQGAFWVIT